jgi:hypothetical protein
VMSSDAVPSKSSTSWTVTFWAMVYLHHESPTVTSPTWLDSPDADWTIIRPGRDEDRLRTVGVA